MIMMKVFYFKKKYIAFIMVCLLLLLLSPYILFVKAPTRPVSYEDPISGIIVIDPGHGGIDGGAVNNNVVEKHINLDISLRLKNILVKRGYKVIMTREEDISLEANGTGSNRHRKDLNARVNVINNSNAQLFVSVHTNNSPNRTSANGSIVFYNNRYAQNIILAYNIQRALNSIPVDSMVRSIHNPVAEKYYLLDRAQVPGVLVETGFISNSRERELLKKDEFRELAAEAIAAGIEEYLSIPVLLLRK